MRIFVSALQRSSVLRSLNISVY